MAGIDFTVRIETGLPTSSQPGHIALWRGARPKPTEGSSQESLPAASWPQQLSRAAAPGPVIRRGTEPASRRIARRARRRAARPPPACATEAGGGARPPGPGGGGPRGGAVAPRRGLARRDDQPEGLVVPDPFRWEPRALSRFVNQHEPCL